MTAAESDVLTVKSPGDLITAVPYLLGFHPSESLVMLGLDGSHVVVTIRVDLAAAATDPGSVASAVSGMQRGGATRFVVIVFDLDAPRIGDELPWEALALEVSGIVVDLGCEVADALLVAEGRYWSYVCFGAGCCPAEGTVVSPDSSEVPARATYAGMVALPDRAALEGLLTPSPEADRSSLAQAISEHVEGAHALAWAGGGPRIDRADVRALFKAARRAADTGDVDLPVDTLGLFAAALSRIPVRDRIWMALDDGRLPDDRLWRHLACVLPAPYCAAPLFLVGWAAWRRGNGALAMIAAERAIEADPGYSAADLLASALVNAVDPRTMPKIRRTARRCDQ